MSEFCGEKRGKRGEVTFEECEGACLPDEGVVERRKETIVWCLFDQSEWNARIEVAVRNEMGIKNESAEPPTTTVRAREVISFSQFNPSATTAEVNDHTHTHTPPERDFFILGRRRSSFPQPYHERGNHKMSFWD